MFTIYRKFLNWDITNFFCVALGLFLSIWPYSSGWSISVGFGNPGIFTFLLMGLLYFTPLILMKYEIQFPYRKLLLAFFLINAVFLPFIVSVFGVRLMVKFAYSLLFYLFLCNTIRENKNLEKIFLIAITGAAIITTVWCYRCLFVLHSPFLVPYWNPYPGSAIGKNIVGAFFIVMFPFAYAALMNKKFPFLISLYYVVLFGFSLLYTISRASLLGLGLCPLLFVLVGHKKHRAKYAFFLSGLAMVLLALQVYFGIGIETFNKFKKAESFFFIRNESFQESSRGHRILLGFEGFKKHPFLGNGIGTYQAEIGGESHNEYATFVFEFGMIGCGLYFGFVGLLMWRFLKIKNEVLPRYRWLWEALMVSLLLCFFNAFFANFILGALCWFIFGSCVTMTLCVKRENRTS